MLPDFLLTVRMPPSTFHCAGDLSFTVTHWSRFWPSKRRMASEGGGMETAGPGVMMGGTGSQTSVSWGVGLGASAAMASAERSRVKRNGFWVGVIMVG